MRKLILLALGLGAIELINRAARRRGITPNAVVADKIGEVAAWFRGLEAKTEPDK